MTTLESVGALRDEVDAREYFDATWADAEGVAVRTVLLDILKQTRNDYALVEASRWLARDHLDADVRRQLLTRLEDPELRLWTTTRMVDAIGMRIEGPDDPAVDLLFGFLEGDRTRGPVFAEQDLIDHVLYALAAVLPRPAPFERLLALIDGGDRPDVSARAFQTVLDPRKEHGVLARLDRAQHVRVVETLLFHQRPGRDIHVSTSAGQALFHYTFADAETALVGALSQVERKDGVRNVMWALRHIATDRAVESLVELLPTESRDVWTLAAVLSELGDQAADRCLARVRRSRSPHAAELWASALSGFRPEVLRDNGALLDLAHVLLTWEPPSDERGGRQLKYAWLECAHSALLRGEHELAVRLVEKAEGVEADAYQSVAELRGRAPWQSPLFVEDGLRRRLDAVRGGALEDERKKLDKRIARARKQNKPLKRIKDEQLELLGGCAVKERLLHNKETGEVFFEDDAGRWCWFDGFEVRGPQLDISRVSTDDAAPRVADVAEHERGAKERVAFWTKNGSGFHDVARHGRAIIWRRGHNGGRLETLLCTAPDEDAAAQFVAAIRANRPAGHVESDPFYVKKRGAVLRTYQGPGGEGRETLGVLEDTWVSLGGSIEKRFPSEKVAIEAFTAWEREKLKSGTPVAMLETNEACRRREELTVREYFHVRNKYPESPMVSLATVDELIGWLDERGQREQMADLALERGPGELEGELRRYEREIDAPLPEALFALWKEHGHIDLKLPDGHSLRWLSPSEARERREEVHARFGERFGGKKLEPLVLDEEGLPRLLFDPTAAEERAFGPFDGSRRHIWYSSLTWTFHHHFAGAAFDALGHAAGLKKTPYAD
jgi:hypothetical protein